VRIHFRRREPPENADIVATGVDPKGVAAIAKGIVFTTDADDLAVGMFGDELAPFGYAYLLVAGGIGCLATVLFTRFSRAASCFQAARTALLGRFPVRVAQESPFGGVGQFLLRPRFEKAGRLYVGEAAGLQDLLWGFGIRTAIESGALAAESLIGGKDYRHLAEDRFLRRHRASIVNRFLWEACRWRDYSLIMAVLQRFEVRMLHALYNEHPLQRLLFPLAARYVGRRMRHSG
jgi:flavin-dependent dehydrogenase